MNDSEIIDVTPRSSYSGSGVPLATHLHNHEPEPFEPDWLRRREKGDVYNG